MRYYALAECALNTHITTVSSRYNLRVNDALRLKFQKMYTHSKLIYSYFSLVLKYFSISPNRTVAQSHQHKHTRSQWAQTHSHRQGHTYRQNTHSYIHRNNESGTFIGMARIASNMVRLQFKPLCICHKTQ